MQRIQSIQKLFIEHETICRIGRRIITVKRNKNRCATRFYSRPSFIHYLYMNDIPKCSKLFEFITYADDTSLASVISTFGKNLNPNTTCQNINTELNKISDWLKVNRLSLNVGKTKYMYMLFHSMKNKLNFPNQGIHVNGTAIERVQTFNFVLR